MWLRSVVFPAPRKPVRTVTGTRSVVVMEIRPILLNSGERGRVSATRKRQNRSRAQTRGADATPLACHLLLQFNNPNVLKHQGVAVVLQLENAWGVLLVL